MLVSEACWVETVLEDLGVLHKVASLPFLLPSVCDVPSVAEMFENLRREQDTVRRALRAASKAWACPEPLQLCHASRKAHAFTRFFAKQGELWHQHDVTQSGADACVCVC